MCEMNVCILAFIITKYALCSVSIYQLTNGINFILLELLNPILPFGFMSFKRTIVSLAWNL